MAVSKDFMMSTPALKIKLVVGNNEQMLLHKAHAWQWSIILMKHCMALNRAFQTHREAIANATLLFGKKRAKGIPLSIIRHLWGFNPAHPYCPPMLRKSYLFFYPLRMGGFGFKAWPSNLKKTTKGSCHIVTLPENKTQAGEIIHKSTKTTLSIPFPVTVGKADCTSALK